MHLDESKFSEEFLRRMRQRGNKKLAMLWQSNSEKYHYLAR
jgi:hypothetical protein